MVFFCPKLFQTNSDLSYADLIAILTKNGPKKKYEWMQKRIADIWEGWSEAIQKLNLPRRKREKGIQIGILYGRRQKAKRDWGINMYPKNVGSWNNLIVFKWNAFFIYLTFIVIVFSLAFILCNCFMCAILLQTTVFSRTVSVSLKKKTIFEFFYNSSFSATTECSARIWQKMTNCRKTRLTQ